MVINRNRQKKILRRLLFSLLFILAVPVYYLLIALLLSYIPVNSATSKPEKTIFLGTNGVHLDLILPVSQIDPALLADLHFQDSDSFLAFGWGDENFYLHTPTWGDLTLGTAMQALFFDNTTLVHLSPHKTQRKEWAKIRLSQEQLKTILAYLDRSFQREKHGNKIPVEGYSYGYGDSFYKARGSYSFRKTCNTWVNDGLKETGLPACYWTPFDFTLLDRYEGG
ncbi:MAG: TIGR02117 family protein [Bacteroidia bacterium]